MTREIQRFHVGIKAFLMDADRLLLLRESSTGLWELPGGRIDVGEEQLPQTEVLRRELGEELGPDARAEIGPLALTWVRERSPGDFVFLVGRWCRWHGGSARLSAEHDALAWVGEGGEADYGLAPGYAGAIAEFRRQLPGLAAGFPVAR